MVAAVVPPTSDLKSIVKYHHIQEIIVPSCLGNPPTPYLFLCDNLRRVEDFFIFYNGGCPSPLSQTNPYRPRGSQANPLWPQCGSAISNPQPLRANYGPRPTERLRTFLSPSLISRPFKDCSLPTCLFSNILDRFTS